MNWPFSRGKSRYKAETVEGRLAVTFDNDYYIGNIFDSNRFEGYGAKFPGWLTDEQIRVGRRIEEDAQQIHKEAGARRFSGLPGYSHILDVIFTELEISGAVNVPLRFANLAEALIHDDQELDRRVANLKRSWEEAAEKFDDKARGDLESKLFSARQEVKAEHESRLVGYLENFDFPRDVKMSIRRDLKSASRNGSHLTRFTEGYMYAKSMLHVFTRQRRETIDSLLNRMFTKLSDRIVNNREYGPHKELPQIGKAFRSDEPFNSGTVGYELSQRFGEINLQAKEMPAAIMIGTAFKSVYPLKFLNEALNKYEGKISDGAYGKIAEEMLSLVRYGRKLLIESATDLLNRAIQTYESELSSEEKARVDREVVRHKKGSFYNRITYPMGDLIDWTYNIDGGNEFMMSLETDKRRFENYRAARHFRELLPMFNMHHEKGADYQKPLVLQGDPNFNPTIHEYFSIKGVRALFELSPDYWDHVGDLKSATPKKSGILKGVRTVLNLV